MFALRNPRALFAAGTAAEAAAATRHVPEALPLRRQMRRLDSQGNGVLLEQLLGADPRGARVVLEHEARREPQHISARCLVAQVKLQLLDHHCKQLVCAAALRPLAVFRGAGAGTAAGVAAEH